MTNFCFALVDYFFLQVSRLSLNALIAIERDVGDADDGNQNEFNADDDDSSNGNDNVCFITALNLDLHRNEA